MAAAEYLGEPPNMDFSDRRERGDDFDSMLKAFKRQSEENLLDNKRAIERKRAGGDKRKAKKRRGSGRG